MTSKSSLLLIILVLSCSALQGQKDWIIQLKGDASLADLQAGWSKTALRSNRDLTTQPIGRHFNIYAIQSVTQLSKETLLRNPAILCRAQPATRDKVDAKRSFDFSAMASGQYSSDQSMGPNDGRCDLQ
ncbi:MAG: hypothetical protein IPO25_05855 [Saprospiraceae bacterium]|nr:hypothetical protein [Saprospiraceae bacterium]